MSSGQKAALGGRKKKSYSPHERVRFVTSCVRSSRRSTFFRINSPGWSAPVNALRPDAWHPSQSWGAPQVRHEGPLGCTADEDETLPLSAVVFRCDKDAS